MAAAGFPNGLDVRYIFTNNAYGERFNQWAEAVSAMLKEGGLRAWIIVQDYNREYIAPNGTFFGRYDGIFFGLETSFPDAHEYLFNMLHSESRRNLAGMSDPQLDAVSGRDGATIDEADRLKQVKEIQRYANQRMYYVPGFIGPGYIALQPWVKGYTYSAYYGDGTATGLGVCLDR